MNPEYLNASIGGAMIGISCLMMLAALGKLTGISGFIWQASGQSRTTSPWLWLFLVGLIVAPVSAHYAFGLELPVGPDRSIYLAIAAGLLVGFGTNLGSGCTSGHGICGIARLSHRSIIATVCFMATGIITVFITRHLL